MPVCAATLAQRHHRVRRVARQKADSFLQVICAGQLPCLLVIGCVDIDIGQERLDAVNGQVIAPAAVVDYLHSLLVEAAGHLRLPHRGKHHLGVPQEAIDGLRIQNALIDALIVGQKSPVVFPREHAGHYHRVRVVLGELVVAGEAPLVQQAAAQVAHIVLPQKRPQPDPEAQLLQHDGADDGASPQLHGESLCKDLLPGLGHPVKALEDQVQIHLCKGLEIVHTLSPIRL